MTTLNFQITTAGRQAAIDADATGLQLKITEVGYGNGTWSPDASATAPQDEFKRMPAGGGDNPAPLYVHVTALDESSDTYQANEVGIYAGNVLFAIWSKGLQPGVDGPGKINTQDSAFAFDLLLTDVPPGSVTVGDTNFSMPLATETKVGVSREATQDEVNSGLLSKIFVSPAKLKAWWDQVRVWDNIKNKPATATRWPNAGEVNRYAGELAIFSTPTLPAGFPGFVLDGSTIPNGVNDFPELAASGSRFITISGNDIILKDAPDFIRGKGSSNRSVGDFQNDAIQNITGAIDLHVTATPDTDGAISYVRTGGTSTSGGSYESLGRMSFDASRVVRTADQNQPKSLTALFAIYHGKVAA